MAARDHRAYARVERWAPGLLVALVCGELAYALAFHEHWRDECQAMLLARDTSVADLLGALRYEGHPPLLHLILKLIGIAVPPPYALAVGGAIGYATLLAGMYRWLRAFTPASRLLATLCTATLASTYTCAYELGIVTRGYGLGLGLALAGAAFAARLSPDEPLRRFTPLLLCLGGAIITAVHTACLALAIALAYAIDAVRRPGLTAARARRLALAAAALVPFVAILADVVVAPADRDFAWMGSALDGSDALAALHDLAFRVLAPQGFWFVWTPPWQQTVLVGTMAAGIAVVVVTGVRSGGKLGWFVIAVMLDTVAVVAMALLRYGGEYRHYTAVVVSWVLCLIASVLGRSGVTKWLVALPLALWLAHQARLLDTTLRRDIDQPFSQTREVADLLPEDAHVVTGQDALATCVAYYRPDVELTASNGGGRAFTFVRWDRAREQYADLRGVVAAACSGAASVYLLIGEPDPALRGDLHLGESMLSPVVAGRGMAFPGEYFGMYEVRCGALR